MRNIFFVPAREKGVKPLSLMGRFIGLY